MTQRNTSPQTPSPTQIRVAGDARMTLLPVLVLVLVLTLITLITVLTGAGNGFA